MPPNLQQNSTDQSNIYATNRKPTFPSRWIKWAAFGLFICLLTLSIVTELIQNQKKDKGQDWINNVIMYGDDVYYQTGYEGGAAFLRTAGASPKYYKLPGGSDTLWVEQQNCFYFGKGKYIYSCGIFGENIEKLTKASEASKVNVLIAADNWLVYRTTKYDGKKYYPSSTYAIHFLTGEVIKLAGDAGLKQTPIYFAAEGDSLYHYRIGNGSIYKYDITTGEDKLLVRTTATPDWHGCVVDGYLYYSAFTSYFDQLCRVPTDGSKYGKPLELDYSAFDMTGVADFACNGNNFVVLLYTNIPNSQKFTVCQLDIEKMVLKRIAGQQQEFNDATNIAVHGDTYYAFGGKQVYIGKSERKGA